LSRGFIALGPAGPYVTLRFRRICDPRGREAGMPLLPKQEHPHPKGAVRATSNPAINKKNETQ